MGFQIRLRKIVVYRDYKQYDNAKFRDYVSSFAFDQFDVNNFKENYLIYLIKMRMKPLITKELYREIMKKKKKFRNIFLRTKSQEDRLKFNKQRNFYEKLCRTTKNLYFSNVDIKKVVDNRSF